MGVGEFTQENKRETASYDWKIESFTSLPHILTALGTKSDVCELGYYKWFLELYSHGSGEENRGFVSVYLHQECGVQVIGLKFSISVINIYGYPSNTFSGQLSSAGNCRHECPRFIKRTDLVAKGLLADDVLRIRLHISIDHGDLDAFATKLAKESGDASDVFQEELRRVNLKNVGVDTNVRVKSQDFQVHRFVLTAHSEVFAAMFRRNMKESSSNTINVEDHEPGVFKEFLRFLYSNRIGQLTCAEYMELYTCADKYMVEGLKPVCEEAIKGEMSTHNVVDVLLFAKKYDLTSLGSGALKFITTFLPSVAADSGWKKLHADLELMEDIINSLAAQ